MDVSDAFRARVTIAMKARGGYNFFDPGLDGGQTIVFTATCDGGRVSWEVSGTAPDAYRRIARIKLEAPKR